MSSRKSLARHTRSQFARSACITTASFIIGTTCMSGSSGATSLEPSTLPPSISYNAISNALPAGGAAAVHITAPHGLSCFLSSSNSSVRIPNRSFPCPTSGNGWARVVLPANVTPVPADYPITLTVIGPLENIIGKATVNVSTESPVLQGTRGTRRIAVLGDSITGLSAADIKKTLGRDHRVFLDGQTGYMVSQELPAVTYALERRTVNPSTMAINLGTNNGFYAYLEAFFPVGPAPWSPVPANADWRAQFRNLFRTLSADRHLQCVIVSNLDTHGPVPGFNEIMKSQNVYLAKLMKQSGKRFHLYDWDGLFAKHPTWGIQSNFFLGVHPLPPGRSGYATGLEAAMHRYNC